MARALMICIGTPLPMAALVFLQECIPLQDPAEGWNANYGFWIRVGILGGVVAVGIAAFVIYMIPGVVMSNLQLALLFTGQAIGYPAIAMFVAALWVFPIPFMVLTVMSLYVLLFAVLFRIIAGKQVITQMATHQHESILLVSFSGSQSIMAITYAAYEVLFDRAIDTQYELPVILLLPLIKYFMKNLVSLPIMHMKDMVPEGVIFTVDFFNSMYLATCMQNTSSITTVATIMTLDIGQTTIALRSLHRRSDTIVARLREACDIIRSLPRLSIPQLPQLAQLNEVKNRVGSRWNCFRRSTEKIKIDARNIMIVKPIQTGPEQKSLEIAPSPHRKILGETLEVLFTSECLVLTEYLESIIPLFYGNYILLVVNLPSAEYHVDLTGINRDNVGGTLVNVYVYAMLEFISFVMLTVLMLRNCRLQALYHLAFVLETQMLLVQVKLMTWVLMTLSFRVVHFASHRGKYSIERLLALEEYSRKTSLLRVLAVCAGTPVPIIIVIFSQGALPLADPGDGWQANWGFWIRSSLMTATSALAVSNQLNYLMGSIYLSLGQLMILSLCVAFGSTCMSIVVASLWAFPIPFMVLTMTPQFLLTFGITIRFLLGATTIQHLLAKRRDLLRFVIAVNIQILMAICYPAYQTLFNLASGSVFELPTFLLLPIIKFVLKNLISLCLAELPDLIPENIIFTVHFFNAMYLATSMQSAASTFAISTIMTIDLLETGIALHGIYRSSNRIMNQLHKTIGCMGTGDTMLTAAYSLCQYHDKFTREEHLQVRVRSCFRHPLSSERCDLLSKLEYDNRNSGPSIPPSSNTQSMPAIHNVQVVASGPRHWSTLVLPFSLKKWNSFKLSSTKQNRDGNAIAAVPSVQHIATLRKALATLFTIECMVLAEYIEFIIPLLYGNYVLMMVRLPSARYHSELAGVTKENAGSTVEMVFIYGMLEFGSFVLLVMLLKKACRLQALYHLAFVLETQVLPIQSKIIGWMLITLGFRVAHFGSCTISITFLHGLIFVVFNRGRFHFSVFLDTQQNELDELRA
ncbi:hypothetical protein PHMEG_0003595 [Phytophthora megakarya]|uniref:Transmembrane protein n=1 Tax=Phytophthora megakarya TaxID=4795 RepID=A0A225WW29_9STRA|nr:hypothetical protein PHMEG_0003595 [Phytophthora megakarya]